MNNGMVGRPGSSSHGRQLDVVLCVMPFGPVREPALGVSILKAAAERAGFSARVRYFNLDFAEILGVDLYHLIAHGFAARELLGDWIFSEALFGNGAPEEGPYIERLLREFRRYEDGVPYEGGELARADSPEKLAEHVVPLIVNARRLANDYVETVANELLDIGVPVVALTSSCHQACSCLAVARRLKRVDSGPTVVIGGPNVLDEMGRNWLRLFPWLDYVCTSEGDEVFPEFLDRLLRRKDPTPPAGILERCEHTGCFAPRHVSDLDSTPLPDFSDYFEQLVRSELRPILDPPRLPIEMSRGCWWGERSQCVFCGDHPATIHHRSKSPERITSELRHQTADHAYRMIVFTDDVSDGANTERVFETLRELPQLPTFLQVRPTLDLRDLEQLYLGGARVLQPGIESLSDSVLRLMRKGTTLLQNIQFLRWCRLLGTRVIWSMLYGLGNEPQDEYERMSNLIPMLTHLEPPMGTTRISLKRFSPYWQNPNDFGVVNVRPSTSYSMIYPLAAEDVASMAYFFDYEYADGRDPLEYTRALRLAVGAWKDLWNGPASPPPRLEAHRHGNTLTIVDTRTPGDWTRYRLTGIEAELLLRCDRPQGHNSLMRNMSKRPGSSEVNRAIDALLRRRLLVEARGRYLSIPIIVEHEPGWFAGPDSI